jgi:hypothetical protein
VFSGHLRGRLGTQSRVAVGLGVQRAPAWSIGHPVAGSSGFGCSAGNGRSTYAAASDDRTSPVERGLDCCLAGRSGSAVIKKLVTVVAVTAIMIWGPAPTPASASPADTAWEVSSTEIVFAPQLTHTEPP